MKHSDSIMQREKECILCRRQLEMWNMPDLPLAEEPLERHHVMHGTANRTKAEEWGLWVWLCHKHHTGSNEAVHMNREADMELIKMGQKAFESRYNHDLWMREFSKNYL